MTSAPSTSRGLNLLLAATTLASAWLLFQVQPMVAKRVLPWFGGGAGVWTTAMLFFQTLLLVGYLYAHLLTRLLSEARQAVVHVAVLGAAAAAALALGILPGDAWKPAASDYPVLRILAMLAAHVGLPFVALAATAPLTQVWFARVNPGRTPYRLYALSNIGSLAALISYPLLIEPAAGIERQGAFWTGLFVAFAIVCAACAAATLRAAGAVEPGAAPGDGLDADADRDAGAAASAASATRDETVVRPRLERLLWLSLPACASVLLLAVTAHLCQDIVSIPLLWIAPMVMYLVSFILAFDSDRWYRRYVWMPLGAVASYAAAYSWHYGSDVPFAWQVGIHCVLMLAAGMVCHGELARVRPAPERLTGYFLSISAGGAIGGFLAAVVAPLVLNDFHELSMALVGVWVLGLVRLVTDRESPFYDGRRFAAVAGMALMLIALCVSLGTYVAKRGDRVVDIARNFYGVLRVRRLTDPDQPGYDLLKLSNGRIAHGAQFILPQYHRVLTQYYVPHSGVGRVLATQLGGSPRRVGIVGLGVGTLASYAERGDVFRFYDINPQVVEIAERDFTYLEDARNRGAKIDIVDGDARLALERDVNERYDVLVLDAFTSDSIPAHLLTLEAFELYLQRLKGPNSVLAVHVSHNYLNFPVVVEAICQKLNLRGWVINSHDQPTDTLAQWILVTRPDSALAQQAAVAPQEVGQPVEDATAAGVAPVLWTDDHNNIVDILKD